MQQWATIILTGRKFVGAKFSTLKSIFYNKIWFSEFTRLKKLALDLKLQMIRDLIIFQDDENKTVIDKCDDDEEGNKSGMLFKKSHRNNLEDLFEWNLHCWIA